MTRPPPSRRKTATVNINLGHGPGQICPFVWAWLQGTRDPGIELELFPAYELLAEWATMFYRLNPDAAPPRGIDDRPDLAVKLMYARAEAARAK